MFFLSAQPDAYYFKWQLELQIYNFLSIGIKPAQIHILIAYDPQLGLNKFFKEFIDQHHHKAVIFTYPDHRNRKAYLSSIRPYLIKQYFKDKPFLEKEAIFYHDSDILFRALPDFNTLLSDDKWYVADTKSYLNSKYIVEAANINILRKMCQIVGISVEKIMSNDANCGGAQYLLKNTTYSFWNKVEQDSESIFDLLTTHNHTKADNLFFTTGIKRSEYCGIQAWCADMWALFYNALYLKKEVNIHPQLNFCWPTDSIEKWHDNYILHYSGKMIEEDKTLFRKTKYIHYSPYFDNDLQHISKSCCSSILVNLITNYRKQLAISRIDLTDISFLLSIRVDSESRLENLYIVLNLENPRKLTP